MNSDFSPGPFIAFGVWGLVNMAFFWPLFGRRRAFQELARKRGFTWMGEEYPYEFPNEFIELLNGRRGSGALSGAKNVVRGRDGADGLLVFDLCFQSLGRGDLRYTVVARRGRFHDKRPIVEAPFQLYGNDAWRVVVSPRGLGHWGLMKTATVERLWEQIA